MPVIHLGLDRQRTVDEELADDNLQQQDAFSSSAKLTRELSGRGMEH